jgi:hypothetical protein
VWSATAIDGGDGEKFADSGEVLREELLKLGRLQAPQDASFRTHALCVEAHLQVHLLDAGVASIDGGNGEVVRHGFGMVVERSRRRGNRIRVRSGAFIGRQGAPRHDVEPGDAASAREKRDTASCCPPREEEDEDVSSFVDISRRGTGLCLLWLLGWAWLLMGCDVGLFGWATAWAVRPGEAGKVFSHFSFLFLFSVLYFFQI